MTKWRVDWKENGEKQSKMFNMHSGYAADMFYGMLKRDAKDPQIRTKLTDIKITEISTSQVWRETYHTPVRSHRKGLSKPTDRIKR
jgi:hypothetical protein